MALGSDLLSLPFADVVAQLALSIAEAQRQLDQNAVEQLGRMLAAIEKANAQAADPNAAPAASAVATLTALKEAGLLPTFYQFLDTEVEVRMAISTTKETGFNGGVKLNLSAVTVDASYSQKYSYRAEGSSVLRTKIVPVAPPAQLKELMEAANKHSLLEFKLPESLRKDPPSA